MFEEKENKNFDISKRLNEADINIWLNEYRSINLICKTKCVLYMPIYNKNI